MIKVTTLDAYIETFPSDIRVMLEQIRSLIRSIVPEATESIKYGIPTFVLNKNIVHFAAFKNHIGFYPTPSGVEKFKKELKEYTVSKGSIHFPLNTPLPLDLIKKIVEFRVEEIKK